MPQGISRPNELISLPIRSFWVRYGQLLRSSEPPVGNCSASKRFQPVRFRELRQGPSGLNRFYGGGRSAPFPEWSRIGACRSRHRTRPLGVLKRQSSGKWHRLQYPVSVFLRPLRSTDANTGMSQSYRRFGAPVPFPATFAADRARFFLLLGLPLGGGGPLGPLLRGLALLSLPDLASAFD